MEPRTMFVNRIDQFSKRITLWLTDFRTRSPPHHEWQSSMCRVDATMAEDALLNENRDCSRAHSRSRR
jgi:hypothetical protein